MNWVQARTQPDYIRRALIGKRSEFFSLTKSQDKKDAEDDIAVEFLIINHKNLASFLDLFLV